MVLVALTVPDPRSLLQALLVPGLESPCLRRSVWDMRKRVATPLSVPVLIRSLDGRRSNRTDMRHPEPLCTNRGDNEVASGLVDIIGVLCEVSIMIVYKVDG